MQRKYGIAGAGLLIILAGLFWLGNGGGANKGTDTPLTPVLRFDHAHGIALDPKDTTNLYIATHDGLYVMKGDKDLFRIGSSRDDLMGFTSHPTESGVFFSSGHMARGGNIGFQKSMDGGMTWERISQGLGGPVDFHAMTISAANPTIVYGFFGAKMQRSIDGGESWEYAGGAIAPLSLSPHPMNPDILYASTQSGVQISEDGGETWRSLSSHLEGGAVSVFMVHPTDPQYALAFSERLGGLGKSVDGGSSWQSITERFGGDTVLYLSFSKGESNIVYALTHSNSVYKSTDRGDTWVRVR